MPSSGIREDLGAVNFCDQKKRKKGASVKTDSQRLLGLGFKQLTKGTSL